MRPFLKLPLEAVAAVRDGDDEACAAVLPYLRENVEWCWSDRISWSGPHESVIFVDATPERIGIVRPGCFPVSVTF